MKNPRYNKLNNHNCLSSPTVLRCFLNYAASLKNKLHPSYSVPGRCLKLINQYNIFSSRKFSSNSGPDRNTKITDRIPSR